MPRRSRYQTGKKSGKLEKARSYQAIPVHQGKHTLFSFCERVSRLWDFVSINRREENKDEGYQRVLSNIRVQAVADYIAKGQISIVNFVRRVSTYVNPEKGLLNIFSLAQQTEIIENYFNGIKQAFPEQWRDPDSIFFKTVGFGALMVVFEDIFKECTMQGEGFRVSDIVEVLRPLQHFDFAQWSSKGTGNKAETEAAKEFQVDFARSIEARRARSSAKQIKLR